MAGVSRVLGRLDLGDIYRLHDGSRVRPDWHCLGLRGLALGL